MKHILLLVLLYGCLLRIGAYAQEDIYTGLQVNLQFEGMVQNLCEEEEELADAHYTTFKTLLEAQLVTSMLYDHPLSTIF